MKVAVYYKVETDNIKKVMENITLNKDLIFDQNLAAIGDMTKRIKKCTQTNMTNVSKYIEVLEISDDKISFKMLPNRNSVEFDMVVLCNKFGSGISVSDIYFAETGTVELEKDKIYEVSF